MGSITKVYVKVDPVIDVFAPVDFFNWVLSESKTGIYTKEGVIIVKANTDWQLTVRDANRTTEGHMTEWIGTTYGNRQLEDQVKVSANHEVVLPAGGFIQTGSNSEGQEVKVTLTQIITEDDLKLDNNQNSKNKNNYKDNNKEIYDDRENKSIESL